jgi:hypothetical protein
LGDNYRFPIGTTAVYTFSATTTKPGYAPIFAQEVMNITVINNERPDLSLPADIFIDVDAGQTGTTVDYAVSATDNSGAVTTTQTGGVSSGGFFGLGTSTQFFLAVDSSGNQTLSSFNVTVTVNAANIVSESPTFALVVLSLLGIRRRKRSA